MAFSLARPHRFAWLGTLCLGLTLCTARAQTASPDTMAPWRYYPLEVGNVWEYEDPSGPYPSVFTQERIVGDTTALGRRYFVVEGWVSSTPSRPAFRDYVRFDTATATPRGLVIRSDGSPIEYPRGCPLDTTLGEEIDCSDGSYGFAELISHDVRHVQIGPGEAETPPDTVRVVVKSYSVGLGFYVEYGADIGVLGEGGEGADSWLTYAQVGGVEYGSSVFPTSGEAPPREAVPLQIVPNPASSTATLSFTPLRPGLVSVEVVDLLGRRVDSVDRPLSVGRHSLSLDVSGLVPGPYVVRVDAGGDVGTARLTVVR